MPDSNTDIARPTGIATSRSNAEVDSANQPKRVLGFRDLLLFYVVTGISLRWIATAAAAGPSSIVIWIGAWFCFYLPLALSVLELSSRCPGEGGLYIWSKRAFGDFSGFMAAWVYWTSNLPFFPAALYFAASNIIFMREHAWAHLSNNATFYVVFSLITLSLATLLNIVGLDIGKWLNNVGALAMWIPAAIVILVGLIAWHRYGSATHFTVHSMIPSTHFNDIIFWSVLTFAFGGCEAASFMGAEIKNPRRTLPLALIIAGATVALCYIGGTVAILLAIPSNEVNSLQGLVQAVSKIASRVGLPGILPLVAFLIALSNIGACGAYLGAVARLPFVAGIDRFLPAAFGRLHPRWKTPWVALLTQFVLGAVFILLGQAWTTVKGAYDVLVSLGVIFYFIPYLYLFAAQIKLQSEAAGADAICVPGGKRIAIAVATLGFTTTALTIALSLVPQPDEANKPLAVLKILGGTVAFLLLGVWIYVAGRRSARRGIPSFNI